MKNLLRLVQALMLARYWIMEGFYAVGMETVGFGQPRPLTREEAAACDSTYAVEWYCLRHEDGRLCADAVELIFDSLA